MLPNTSLPGNPSDAGPDARSTEPAPDWRELLMIAGEELQFVRNHNWDTPAQDKAMRLSAIASAQFMLEQAAKELQ